MVDRDRTLAHNAWHGFHRIFAPMEPASLLGNNRRHPDRRQSSVHWRIHPESPAWRTQPERPHTTTLLLGPYLDDPRCISWFDRSTSVPDHQTWRVAFPDQRRLIATESR